MSRPFTVLRSDTLRTGALRGAAIAIGNFDGVHRGHRSVIGAAQARAEAQGKPAAALTFEPHPRAVLQPQAPLFRLTDERAKLRLLAGTGLDGAVVLTFDPPFSAMTAQEFVDTILVGALDVSAVAIGFDFHFGHKRGGSPAFLQEQAKRYDFAVDILPPLEDEGRPVSSSAIRAALESGQVVEAAELLGGPWFVSGPVIHGEKRGRDLGFPTANLRLAPECRLKHGIYAVRVAVDGARYDGVASFGRRPTFDDGAPLLETFLFDFSGDLYGREIDVAFIGWIRPELKFDSIEALVARMQHDARAARDILARAPAAFPTLG